MIGPLNPCPMRLGGGPTEVSRAYTLLRGAVGIGGSAPDDRGIEGLWRRSRARGAAASGSAYRRAILQVFPHLATDALPYYERVLGITPDRDASETERRQAVVSAWTSQLSAVLPSLLEQLQRVDARFALVVQRPGHHTQAGRTLAPLDPGGGEPPWGDARNASEYPAASDGFVLRVRFAVGYAGKLLGTDLAKVQQAEDILRRALPAWQTWSLTTSSGFLCGSSLLGRTGVTDQ